MSCGASNRWPKCSRYADSYFAKWFLALGLLAGSAVFSVFANPPAENAEKSEKGPEKKPEQLEQLKQGEAKVQKVQEKALEGHEIDDRSPLPPTDDITKIPIPDPDRAIFAGRLDQKGNLIAGSGIVDFEEIASENRNKDEFDAWNVVVKHAKQFTAARLEEFAGRDPVGRGLIWDDLIGQGVRAYRLRVVRFDGKIARVRRLTASKELRDAGTQEVYEAQLIPYDSPPTESVSLVFTELPPALAGLAQKPLEEWLNVDADGTGAGYFFKVKQEPYSTDKVPVVIGKSITMLRPGSDTISKSKELSKAIAIDKGLQVFRGIKDDARMASGSENWQEAVAWNRVLLHARRFTLEDLESNARDDLRFADLFEEIRRDYSLQLVKFEGRLLMVRKMEPSPQLKAAGAETLYEGWLAPQNEPHGNPVCIVFTDPLPEGVETGRISKWVSFAGYYFKLLRYTSGEQDEKKKYVTKRAPLLLGRGIVLRPDPERPSSITWSAFATGAIVVVAGLLGVSLGLNYWFRRGDKRAKEEMAAQRAKNPFVG
jgi:hypothetical protein